MTSKTMDFELWLEFEQWVGERDDDPTDDCFNMKLTLTDGRIYAFNVWTFAFVPRAREQAAAEDTNLKGRYLNPPDLLVERLERRLLEEVAADLIISNALPEHCRVPGEE